MEIIIILLLLVLAVIFQQKKMFSGLFIFISGILILAFGLTTNTITSVSNGIITYGIVDPLATYVIGFSLLTIAFIHFLDNIDVHKGDDY